MNAVKKIRTWLDAKGYDGIILSRRDNFSWVTGGKRNYVLESSENGIASLIVKPDRIDLISDNIDMIRICEEEIEFDVNGLSYQWYESKDLYIKNYIGVENIAADTYIEGTTYEQDSLVEMRMQLSEKEIISYKLLGKECAEIVEHLCRSSKGLTEESIASNLKTLCIKRGIHADCVLVGSDERVLKYRHPMPTTKRVKDSLMVVLGAERDGLYISITRMVYYKKVPDEIYKKYVKVQHIFAIMQTMMREGMSYKEYFDKVSYMYDKAGYGDEWKLHHQGGPTGYSCREFIVKKDENKTIRNHQAYAWNPSITGTKCEETSLLTDEGFVLLTMTDSWPRSLIKNEYGECSVADILIL